MDVNQLIALLQGLGSVSDITGSQAISGYDDNGAQYSTAYSSQTLADLLGDQAWRLGLSPQQRAELQGDQQVYVDDPSLGYNLSIDLGGNRVLGGALGADGTLGDLSVRRTGGGLHGFVDKIGDAALDIGPFIPLIAAAALNPGLAAGMLGAGETAGAAGAGAGAAGAPSVPAGLGSGTFGLGAATEAASIPFGGLTGAPVLTGGGLAPAITAGSAGAGAALAGAGGAAAPAAAAGSIWNLLDSPQAWLAGGQVAGGLIAADAAGDAADAQVDASREANETLWRMFEQSREDLEPWRQAGIGALGGLTAGMAEGGEFTQPFNFEADQGYQFRLDEGRNTLENSAAARGGLLSGNTLKALTQYGQDFASGEYSNAYNRWNNDMTNRFNRLSSLAGTGQTATTNVAQLGQNTAGQVGANQIGAGNANAAGSVGRANAINSTLGNLQSMYTLNQILQRR